MKKWILFGGLLVFFLGCASFESRLDALHSFVASRETQERIVGFAERLSTDAEKIEGWLDLATLALGAIVTVIGGRAAVEGGGAVIKRVKNGCKPKPEST